MRTLMTTLSLGCVVTVAWAAAAENGEEPQPQPERPFTQSAAERQDARPGWMLLSDDTLLEGSIFTTRGKPLTIFDREEKEYVGVAWADVARIDVTIEKDVLERDWRWKEGGSDVKVYTDLYYIWHKYLTTLSLKDGEKITGDISAPVYIVQEGEEKRRRFLLHRRSKGDKAEKDEVAAPVYIMKLVLTDLEGAEEPPPPPEEDAEEKKEENEQ